MEIEDPTKEEISFVMPEEGLRIRATYTDQKPGTATDKGDGMILWIVLASGAAVVVLGAVSAIVLVKKKKSKKR